MLAEFLIGCLTVAVLILFTAWMVMKPQKSVLRVAVPVFIISFTCVFVFFFLARLGGSDPLYGIQMLFPPWLQRSIP